MPTPKPPAMTEEERKARNREACRKYREANPEKVRERKRKWYEANREKELERRRLYCKANPEKVRESARQWRAANPERVREYQSEYQNANPERKRESQRQWREANPERRRESARQWRAANPDKHRENGRLWREANPERRRESVRLWRKANPGRLRGQWRQKNHIRRARQANAIDLCAPRVTADAINRRVTLFGNACAYCGGDGPFHIDHVEPLVCKGLHTPTNLVPACQRCNLSKNARPVEAWYLSQPFFCPDRWAALKRHTGRKWSEVEQLTLLNHTP